jgi:two-component sensor histidine kinase
LHELVLHHVQVFTADASRLKRDGPEIFLGTSAAQNVGMALHELATNCVKYGALSVDTGHVEVRWAVANGNDGNSRVTLTWTERGGPPVKPPTRKGFGRFVTQDMIVQSMDAEVVLDYAPAGLVWTLVFPATHLVTRSVTQLAAE